MKNEGVFEWHRVERPARNPGQRTAIYRRELQDRAALLKRLGFTLEAARKRLLDNVAWDFEVGGDAAVVSTADVNAILDEIWKRGGPASGGVPSI